jgi:undecaprenyl-diphosphatase
VYTGSRGTRYRSRAMDEAILFAINGLRSGALDPIAGFLSDWGLFGYLVVLVAIGVARRTRADLESMRDGWLAFFVASFASDTVIKRLVSRPRPTAIPEIAHRLHVLGTVPPASSTSLPSGTAAACAASAAWFWIRFGPRAGIVAALYALLVSLTRLYVGVHWPSDLLAGWIVGVLVAIGIDRLNRVIAGKRLSP